MTHKGQIMTTLNEIMSPKSIAIVGASDNKGRIGGRPLAHMIEQKFSGGIFQLIPIEIRCKV
jgi:acyl-CoA synthetase (NDP forming)